jgi:hypothetical protein
VCHQLNSSEHWSSGFSDSGKIMKQQQAQALANTRCPLCGAFNFCVPAQATSFDVDCWCRSAKIDAEVLAAIPPEQLNKACLCPGCAGAMVE